MQAAPGTVAKPAQPLVPNSVDGTGYFDLKAGNKLSDLSGEKSDIHSTISMGLHIKHFQFSKDQSDKSIQAEDSDGEPTSLTAEHRKNLSISASAVLRTDGGKM